MLSQLLGTKSRTPGTLSCPALGDITTRTHSFECRFGNLVTNATWSDFFLNEGFTMYAERRIIEVAHGR